MLLMEEKQNSKTSLEPSEGRLDPINSESPTVPNLEAKIERAFAAWREWQQPQVIDLSILSLPHPQSCQWIRDSLLGRQLAEPFSLDVESEPLEMNAYEQRLSRMARMVENALCRVQIPCWYTGRARQQERKVRILALRQYGLGARRLVVSAWLWEQPQEYFELWEIEVGKAITRKSIPGVKETKRKWTR